MKTDVNGASTCPVGAEQWEEFSPSWRDGIAIQYDYRAPNGRLYSTVAPDLETARMRRDEWARNHWAGAQDFTRKDAARETWRQK